MGNLNRFLELCCSCMFLFLHKKVCADSFLLSKIIGICDGFYNNIAAAKFVSCQHYLVCQLISGLNHMLVVSYAVSLVSRLYLDIIFFDT